MDQTNQNKKLKICAWNACGGLANKKVEIENFLNSHDVDIFLVSETLLSDKCKFNFPSYKTYKNRSDNNKRCTAIFIKHSIDHFEIPLALTDVEATAVIIKAKNKNIAIISTYNSPSKKFNKNDYDKIFKTASMVISAGDFNAKHTWWGSRSKNPLGAEVQNYCFKNDLSFHAPSEFIFYPHCKRYKLLSKYLCDPRARLRSLSSKL